MEKGLSSDTKNSPDTQPLHAAHLQSGEQPISSEGHMGPWTGATEEPPTYVLIRFKAILLNTMNPQN